MSSKASAGSRQPSSPVCLDRVVLVEDRSAPDRRSGRAPTAPIPARDAHRTAARHRRLPANAASAAREPGRLREDHERILRSHCSRTRSASSRWSSIRCRRSSSRRRHSSATRRSRAPSPLAVKQAEGGGDVARRHSLLSTASASSSASRHSPARRSPARSRCSRPPPLLDSLSFSSNLALPDRRNGRAPRIGLEARLVVEDADRLGAAGMCRAGAARTSRQR